MGRLLSPAGVVIRVRSDGECPDPVLEPPASRLYLRPDFGGGTESNPSTVQTWPRSSVEKGERDRDPVQRNTGSGWVSRSARSPVRRPATLSPLMRIGSVRGASGLPAEGWRQRFSAVVIAWRIKARGDASLDSSRPAQ